MNDTPNEFNGTPDEEAQLTAFVLGELNEVDAESMARRVEGNPALESEVAAIRATTDDVAKVFSLESAPGLTDAQRAAITAGSSGAVGNGVLFSFLSLRSVWAGAGLAAAACLAIAFLWPAIVGPGRSQGPVAFENAAPEDLSTQSPARDMRWDAEDRDGLRSDGRLEKRAAPAADSEVAEQATGAPGQRGGAPVEEAKNALALRAAGAADDLAAEVNDALFREAEQKTAAPGKAPAAAGAEPAARRRSGAKRKAPGSGAVGGAGGAGSGYYSGGSTPPAAAASPSGVQPGDAPALADAMKEGTSVTDGSGEPPALASQKSVVLEGGGFGFRRTIEAVEEDDIALWSKDEAGVDAAAPDFNREAFGHLVDNSFMQPMEAPQSTFSIDVDTASYSNVRRFISSGHLPPKDAVRIEELINYFDYEYPSATGEHPFSVTTDVRACPWNEANRLVRIGLRGRDVERDMRPATNLVFLLDVSGSMSQRNKLPLVKESLGLLVKNLTGDDRVAIVVYAGAAGLVLPSTFCNDREAIIASFDNLQSGGPTAGGAGIELAYSVAQKNFIEGGVNRVVLCTDGDFNVGVSSEGDLTRLIEEKRKSGVFLSVLGFGTGNFQDDRMEKLSNAGNGNFAYIDSIDEARKVLVDEMAGTLVTIAKDVKIQVEFNPTRVGAYRLIGYANRIMPAQDFRNDLKDAGEIGAGHTVTAVYEITPPGVDIVGGEADELHFQEPAPLAEAAQTNELMLVKLRYKLPDGDESTEMEHVVADDASAEPSTPEDFDFVAAVAGFGMLLRDSADKGDVSFDMVLRLAGAEGRPDADERRVAHDLVDRFADQVKRDRVDLAAVFAESLTSVPLSDVDLAATIDADAAVRARLDAALAACPRGKNGAQAIDRLRVRLASGRMALSDRKAAAQMRHRAEFVDLVERAREISDR